MNPGKAMSQCHHAGVQMMCLSQPGDIIEQYVQQGIALGADHFNTTLVLAADLPKINHIAESARQAGYTYGFVTDPTYPFVVDNEIAALLQDKVACKVKQLPHGKWLMTRREHTVAWFVGDRLDEIFVALFQSLALHA
tara:strand:+ start:262 stop:675 length:414 start_codon:yes stop_codon:yes gene_type:complete